MGEKRHLVVLMLIVMGCLLIQGCSVGMALSGKKTAGARSYPSWRY